jgi:DNA-binding PadR family transcriptional regulator
MTDRTATRNAILGHLALRDWSAYELARSLRRTLHWFWPRAESVIYAEVKKLEAEGLAETREEPAIDGSARSRTVYSITKRGRKALARWLETPATILALDIEPLLRLHLMRFGTKEQAIEAMQTLNDTAKQLLADAEAVATEFVEGRHLLQDEAHIRGLLFDALYSLGRALEGSSGRAIEEIERWKSLDGDARSKARGVALMREALDEMQGVTAAGDPLKPSGDGAPRAGRGRRQAPRA